VSDSNIQRSISVSDRNQPGDAPVLNVAAVAARTQALGPGARAAIWVQGCPIHCPGCLAPAWIPFVPAMQLTPGQILEKLDLDRITGISLSGGEPFMQAAGLAAFVRLARREKDLDVICFTGFRYEHLLKNPLNNAVSELLGEVDVLIDGPFIQALNDGIGLRGSSNQRIIHLTSRLRDCDLEAQTRKVEITIASGELAFIGIPTPQVLPAVERAISADRERTA
jgi:anaerobic ribonucleoside-triphosphate reductase activating protein